MHGAPLMVAGGCWWLLTCCVLFLSSGGVKCRYAIYDRSRVQHRLRANANPAAALCLTSYKTLPVHIDFSSFIFALAPWPSPSAVSILLHLISYQTPRTRR